MSDITVEASDVIRAAVAYLANETPTTKTALVQALQAFRNSEKLSWPAPPTDHVVIQHVTGSGESELTNPAEISWARRLLDRTPDGGRRRILLVTYTPVVETEVIP